MSSKKIFYVVIAGCFLIQYFLPICLNALTAAELPEKQQALANRYTQLEQALSRMSMATAKTDPKRAALLEKVLLLSKERLVGNRLENIVALLEKNRLSDSALGQKEVEKDIAELLQLLESDNKKDVNALKREQLQKLIKELTELYNKQRIAAQKAASQDKENLKSLADEQEKLRQTTEELRKNLDELEGKNVNNQNEKNSDNSEKGKNSDNSQEGKSDESEKGKSGESQKSESDKSQKGESGESQKSESGESQKDESDKSQKGESGESQKDESDKSQKGESGESQKSESSESQEGKSGKSQKGQSGDQSGESGENKDDENKSESDKDDSNSDAEDSAQRDLRKANKHQKQANKNLKEKKKNDAHTEMEDAAAQIIKAKEKLMKMLRQLREEELMQTLEKLNARFKRMLQVELAIRTQTELLGNEIKLLGVDSSEMRQMKIRASKLGEDQGSLIKDADAALVLLREDGTAQAMLESLLQVRFDIDEAKSRLDKAEIDSVTLDVEDAIISALQEMIEAVDDAIKESDKRKKDIENSPSPSGPQAEKEEPLIQLLAELKMIRSMQKRVNDRTERYENLTTKKLQEDPKSDLEPIRKNVEELTRQQNRISRILHDIKVGKIKK
jgi:hypothetical protein